MWWGWGLLKTGKKRHLWFILSLVDNLLISFMIFDDIISYSTRPCAFLHPGILADLNNLFPLSL